MYAGVELEAGGGSIEGLSGLMFVVCRMGMRRLNLFVCVVLSVEKWIR